MDLSSLMQVAPEVAGFMTGQQNNSSLQDAAMQRANLQATIDKIRQEMSNESQMLPYKMDYQQALTQQANAQANDFLAQAANRNYQTTLGNATMGSDISKAASEALEKKTKSSADQDSEFTRQFLQLGPELSQMNETVPGERTLYAVNKLKALGMPEDHNLLGLIKSIPSAQLPQAISSIATEFARQNPKYIENTDVANIHGKATTDAAKIHAGATIQAAQIRANAVQQAASAKGEALSFERAVAAGKVSPDKAAVYYQMKYAQENDPELKQFYGEQAQKWGDFVINKGPTPPPQIPGIQAGEAKSSGLGASNSKAPTGGLSGSTSSGVKFKVIQ